MFVAMNRFKVSLGLEDEFIEVWKNRESYLDTVPGYREFNLLRGDTTEEFTLFASHTIWESKQVFEDWTKSESFRKAHANAGGRKKDLYVGHPQFEGFESVL